MCGNMSASHSIVRSPAVPDELDNLLGVEASTVEVGREHLFADDAGQQSAVDVVRSERGRQPRQMQQLHAFAHLPTAPQLIDGKGKVFPYSLPSVGPGADPGVQAVSPQVT